LISVVFWAQVAAKSSVVGVDDVDEFVAAVDRQLVVVARVRQRSYTAFHLQLFILNNGFK